MWKRFTAENSRNWIDMTDKLLNEYNNTFHRTIGMSPMKASKLDYFKMKASNVKQQKPKFSVDDKVRISRTKAVFEKGYLPNWSEAIYIIHEVKKTSPVTYIIKDSSGEILEGSFYEQELQKTDQDVYRIEKVLRKKLINGVEHGLVKWMGYSNKYNEWVPITNLQSLNKS